MSNSIKDLIVEDSITAPEATGSTQGLMSPTDKTKIDTVQSGATANSTDSQLRDRATHTGTQTASTISDFNTASSTAAPVQSVAGKTGTVSLVKADVGLSNVDNTSDANKPVSTAQATAIGTAQTNAESYADGLIASLKGTAPLTLDTLQELAEALNNNPAQIGDILTALGNRLRVDINNQGLNSTEKTNAKTNIDLQNVDNTSDINKPISSATQTALNSKQALDATLTALSSFNSNGFLTQTALDTFVSRIITGTAGNISVSNGDGLSGNPVIDLVNAGTAGTYGSASSVPVFITDSKGRVTSVTNTIISIASTAITDFSNAVRTTVLTGYTVGAATSLATTDTILQAFGKIQGMINSLTSAVALKYDASNPAGYETPAELNTRDTNNRNRTNHTGSQAASTISDFSAAVRLVTLAGVSFVNSAVLVTDSLLVAIGKLQGQITQAISDFNAAQLVQDNRLTALEATDAEWQELIKNSADVLNASNATLTNIPELGFTAVANRRYYMEYTIKYRAAATGTGLAITLGTPNGAVGSLACVVNIPVAADGTAAGFTGSISALGDIVTSSGTPAATPTDHICNIKGIFQCTTGGTVLPQFRSEVNGSNINFRQYSVALIKEFV
jgi:hypothetical protein